MTKYTYDRDEKRTIRRGFRDLNFNLTVLGTYLERPVLTASDLQEIRSIRSFLTKLEKRFDKVVKNEKLDPVTRAIKNKIEELHDYADA